jgi:hypothetical protein
MRRATETVWYTDQGRVLLKTTADPDEFSVVPATCDRETLRELRDAIVYALSTKGATDEPD